MLLLLCSIQLRAQEEQIEQEDAMENLAYTDESALEKLTSEIPLKNKGKLNVNKAMEKDLMELGFLSQEQIRQFILYRNHMGDLISLYELQSIPFWDENTTRKAIPYFSISTEKEIVPDLKQRIKEGDHLLLFRTGNSKSGFGVNGSNSFSGYSDLAKGYKQLIKYQYQFRTLLQWGVTIEKDAGEKNMADFLGYYLYLKKRGMIKSLVLGDYVVNIGQGLIEWQGYAFGQSSNIVGALRQGDAFLPHTGSDENRYHKGFAITLEKKNIQLSICAGREKIDANIILDSLNIQHRYVSSLLTSGLHRTSSEVNDKNTLIESVLGVRIALEKKHIQAGITALQYFFDIPIEKKWLPYNYYSPRGKSFTNAGIDFKTSIFHSYTFGEYALNQSMASALLLGCMKSLDSRMDVSIIFRNIAKDYVAFQPNALIRNGSANNEKGFFSCMNLQLDPRHRIELYRDQYINTWPVYFNDGIRRGNSSSVQFSWRPNKKTEMTFRFKQDAETKNERNLDDKSNRLEWTSTSKMRLHISFMANQDLTIRQRIEWALLKNEHRSKEKGSLYYVEIIYKPMMKPFSASARATIYQTDSYDTRIYAYERDVRSYFSIPAYFDTGMSNYLLGNWKINKHFQSQFKYIFSKSKAGDMMWGNRSFGNLLKKEWRMQLIWEW